MDLVSIIVPVYNAELYLDSCIRSITLQTYTNLEIILVDDGSTDSSAGLCDAWQQRDPRIRVVHQDNGGVSAARNAGLSAAAGDYILMADSDDYIAPETVEFLLGSAKDQEADLVISDFITGSSRTHLFSAPCSGEKLLSASEIMHQSYENPHAALRFIAPWGKLYRRHLFDNIRYPDGKIFEDIYITHQLLWKCKKIVSLDAVLTYYFHHDSSIMHQNFHLGKLDYLEALAQRVSFFQERGCHDLADIAYDEYLHSLIWEYSRVRDILHNKPAMKDLAARFREAYKPGHQSRRYPKETTLFLAAFHIHPESIMLYWRIRAKLNDFFPGKGA